MGVNYFLFFDLDLILGELDKLESILNFLVGLGGRVAGAVDSKVIFRVLALV